MFLPCAAAMMGLGVGANHDEFVVMTPGDWKRLRVTAGRKSSTFDVTHATYATNKTQHND